MANFVSFSFRPHARMLSLVLKLTSFTILDAYYPEICQDDELILCRWNSVQDLTGQCKIQAPLFGFF